MTYKCAVCEGVFEEGWSDEEAVAELNKDFPGFTKDQCDIVCEDCYKNCPEISAGLSR